MDTLFTTDRLTVRHLTTQDEDGLFKMHADPQTMRYVGGPLSREQNKEDLRKILGHYAADDTTFLVWGIFRSHDDTFVGTCALVVNEHGEQEIGYRLSRSQWGNGYGLEITEGLIDYAFRKLHIRALVAYVDSKNAPSVRILDRSSFLFEREYYNEELQCTDRKYVLNRDDWQASMSETR